MFSVGLASSGDRRAAGRSLHPGRNPALEALAAPAGLLGLIEPNAVLGWSPRKRKEQ